jgi:hypothetical protein
MDALRSSPIAHIEAPMSRGLQRGDVVMCGGRKRLVWLTTADERSAVCYGVIGKAVDLSDRAEITAADAKPVGRLSDKSRDFFFDVQSQSGFHAYHVNLERALDDIAPPDLTEAERGVVGCGEGSFHRFAKRGAE